MSRFIFSFKKRLLRSFKTATFALGATLAISGGGGIEIHAAMNTSEFPSGYSYPTQMRGLSAFELVNDMGAGWNLGNSLESENNETYWGNPRTTKKMIDEIAQKGFKTLRIPVRWDDNYSNASSYTINSDYMDRVETVVNYGLANGMYVIINVHYNDLQNMVSTDYNVQQRVKSELSTIWTQVGNRFKNYGDKLIFEVNNEPRNGEDWNGNTAYYNCVNDYNEAGRSAIRATGGNNTSRLVLLPTYCASSDTPKINGWKKLANDDMVAVSIHAYLPFDFAFESNGHSNWTESDYNALSTVFNNLNATFISKGIPVVIGEFGATNKGNTTDREKYVEVYTAFAKQFAGHRIPCIWWDNNGFGVGGEKFGIFNRDSATFTYDGIASALVKAYKSDSDDDDSNNYVSLFWGTSSASNWGQAVTVATKRYGGDFDSSKIKAGGHFYVEYGGTKDQLELILQSLSGGENWSKVAISESGTANGHYFAKFSYENCVTAFETSNFGELLDKIYVGATDKEITVYSLCYDYGEENSGNNEKERYTSLFWGDSSASDWKQAVSIMTTKNGGSFNGEDLTSNGYFYIEYSGNKDDVEFILQSWSGGEEWSKVIPYEVGTVNGNNYTKYNYSNCVAAFGTNDFANKLDQIHVGAKQGRVTVYSVGYCYT